MMTWIGFWLAKLVVQLSIAMLVFVVVVSMSVPRTWRQWRCRHDGYVSETQACDAICCKCGKNLGFIGTWRSKHQKGA